MLCHLRIRQVLADARVDFVQRRPANTTVALDILRRLHGASLAARPHCQSLHVAVLNRRDEAAQHLRVLLSEGRQIRVAADAVLEVVLRLSVTREEDGFRLGVEIHHEGDDRRRQVASDVVGDVTLAVVLVDLRDAVGVRLLVLEVVVAASEEARDSTSSSGRRRGSRSLSWRGRGRSPCTRWRRVSHAGNDAPEWNCRSSASRSTGERGRWAG